MKLPLYQIDAFADRLFEGNPAAVCPLDNWLPDEILQAVAAENNLSETAFFVSKDGGYELRWFTPAKEVDLCGHATLAAAHVLFEQLGFSGEEITFHTRSGPLRVRRAGENLEMEFPALELSPCEPPIALVEGLGLHPRHCLKGMNYMAVFDREEEVQSLQPDFHQLMKLDLRGVIATAPGEAVDFVSRFFAPNVGVNEDPVTGSAHCALAPYWSKRLSKTAMIARQISGRAGTVHCRLQEDRVLLVGRTVSYLEGTITIPSPEKQDADI